MVLKIFLRLFLLCTTSVLACHAEALAVWLPARVLGIVYPSEAKFARIEGDVRARCILREDGSVADVIILSGHPVLARSVKANLLRWTFRRSNDEREKEREAMVAFSFQFKGSCDNHRGCKEEYWFDYPGRVTVVSELPRVNTRNK